jgi:hypothetical protein
MSDLRDGWAWPGLANKAHYFVGATSLCRRWMFSGDRLAEQAMTDKPGPDDCTPCWKAAKKRLDKEAAS